MLARIAALSVVLAAVGCSKSDTAARSPALVDVPVLPVVAPPAEVPELPQNGIDPAEFAHVIHLGNTPYVVLSARPDHEGWGKGAPSLVSDQNPVVTRREVNRAALPKSIARHVGHEMRLVGDKGEVCRGTLAQPVLVSRVEPHFGERSRWDGEQIDEVKQPPFTREQIAKAAWDMTTDGKLLVSELVLTNGDCQDAQFARSNDLPMVETGAKRKPSSAVDEQAMQELRKMPVYASTEEAYRGWSAAEPNKDWTEDGQTIITVSEYSLGGERYVWLSASAGAVCEGFSRSLGVFWRVTQTNSKQLRFELLYEGEADSEPRMLMRLGPDQAPVLLGRESLGRKGSEGYTFEDLHVPYLDCPC